MKRALAAISAGALLTISAHRLPAPILEPTPEATTAKPQTAPAKQKSSEASDSSAARRFNGTWKGTGTSSAAGSTSTYSTTLIIKDGKTADATSEMTATLTDPRGWANFS